MIEIHLRSRGFDLEFDYHWVTVPSPSAHSTRKLVEHLGIGKALSSSQRFHGVAAIDDAAVLVVHGIFSQNRTDAIGRAVVDTAILVAPVAALSNMIELVSSEEHPDDLLGFDQFVAFDPNGDFRVIDHWLDSLEQLLHVKELASTRGGQGIGFFAVRDNAGLMRFKQPRPWQGIGRDGS